MPSESSVQVLSFRESYHIAQKSSGVSDISKVERDISCHNSNNGDRTSLTLLAVEQARTLVKMESFQREKHISVDPISVNASIIQRASFQLVLSPSAKSQNPSGGILDLPLPLPPPKLKFLGANLPSSTTSSLNTSSNTSPKKIWKSQKDRSPSASRPLSTLSRHLSVMDDSQLDLQQSVMPRSKSMGEGRASAQADDFDLWLEKPSAREKQKSKELSGRFSKELSGRFSKQYSMGVHSKKGKSREKGDPEGFKCPKFCLFLPRGKGKPLRASSSKSSLAEKTEPQPISKRVSLEMFECGSWSSSVLVEDNGEAEMANMFFDLPLELVRCSVSDIQSSVTASFIFGSEGRSEEPRGVLKNGSTKMNVGKSQELTGRHVRFSTSSQATEATSPTCITPRLRKAREDFNAFLQAQSA
ncbi:hypothetical protein Droror1_Dr00007967 [Drosera rotundifolia]